MAKAKTQNNEVTEKMLDEAYEMNSIQSESYLDPSTGEVKIEEITSDNIQKEHEEEEIYFTSPSPLPVEIVRQTGSFYPKDKQTKEISTELMFKTESYIADPQKQHPVFYNLYSTEKKPNGFYVATLSMSYFRGRFESVLRYQPVSKQQFDEAFQKVKSSGTSAWETGMKVEIYGNEPAGRGFNHEAYLQDPVRKRPVLMDCYHSEKLPSGVYSLSVDLERRQGKLMPLNKYIFIEAHKQEENEA